MDYLSPLANNVAYAIAVERIAGIELPERCEAIRVLVCELARISSHLLGMGVFGMDAGAWTPFMYTFTEREKLYTLFEELTGARFTTSYTRIGGVARDVPEGWPDRVTHFCMIIFPRQLMKWRNLPVIVFLLIGRKVLVRFPKRMHWPMVLLGQTFVHLVLISILRKDKPYPGYEKYDFDVPIGTRGDCYDRYLVRIEEVRQSLRIVKQVIDNFPSGLWYAEDARKIFAPPKEKVMSSMEELIQNFMIVTEGPQIPAGEVYFEAENPKGALGFYVISKGGGVPYRLKIRAPSFCNLSILEKMVPGHMLSDITVILGSLDFVMGECDR